MCDTEESTASNDPVISRIKRDVERKQEFLRATHLPNYLASPTVVQQPSSEDQIPQIVQGESRQPPLPVYFGDRFPVHQPRGDEDQDTIGQNSRSGTAGQFHLYGLQLGKFYVTVWN